MPAQCVEDAIGALISNNCTQRCVATGWERLYYVCDCQGCRLASHWWVVVLIAFVLAFIATHCVIKIIEILRENPKEKEDKKEEERTNAEQSGKE